MTSITCIEIPQIAEELKMKFTNCKVLKAEDLDLLVELVEAIGSCVGGGEYNQNNKVKIISLEGSYPVTEMNVAQKFNQLPLITILEDEIYLIKSIEEDELKNEYEALYIFKKGKGVYGSQTGNLVLNDDFALLNKSSDSLQSIIETQIINLISNVGVGKNVYKGYNNTNGRHEFKSVVAKNASINQLDDEVEVDTTKINTSVGPGVKIYNGYSEENDIHEFKSIIIEENEGSPLMTSDYNTLKLKSLSVSNLTIGSTSENVSLGISNINRGSEGVSLYTYDQALNNHEFKKLASNTLNINSASNDSVYIELDGNAVNGDWEESDPTSIKYIENKQNVLREVVKFRLGAIDTGGGTTSGVPGNLVYINLSPGSSYPATVENVRHLDYNKIKVRFNTNQMPYNDYTKIITLENKCAFLENFYVQYNVDKKQGFDIILRETAPYTQVIELSVSILLKST